MTDTTLTRWLAGAAFTDSGGPGPAVLLIHGGGSADWFTPLAATPALRRYRVIRLVRAGYTDVPAPDGLTVADHAGHAAALLRHLDVATAHVVAHSSGTTVALQFAFDHPDLVHSLTLCEPPLVDALAAPADHDLLRTALGPVIGAAMAATARGDHRAAFDTFMTAVCGPGYREVLADDRCPYFFTDEMPAVAAWTVDDADLARLPMPVLLVRGGASPPPVHRLVAHLAGLIPTATVTTLAGADHLMPLTRPEELAALVDGLADPEPR